VNDLSFLRLSDILARLNSTLDNMFSGFLNDNISTYGLQKSNYPKIDAWEDDDILFMEAAIPGLTNENVKVEWNDNVLSIQASAVNKKDTKEPNYRLNEIHKSSFTRSFAIKEEEYKVCDIVAAINNGVLLIRIPKVKSIKSTAKQIIIN